MRKYTKKLEFNKKISINFDGGEITGHAGLLSFHEFSRKLGVEQLLNEYFREEKSGNQEYTQAEIIYQKIIRIVGGYTSNNHASFLQNDPVFQEIHNGQVASPATCCRVENRFDYGDESTLRKIQREIEARNIRYSSTQEIIIDLDSTKDPASETLQGSNFNAHYQINGFSPLFAFNGLNGDVIGGILKPGDTHCSKHSESFLRNCISFYQHQGIFSLSVRGDSAFPSEKIFTLCEKNNVNYAFKLKAFDNLVRQVTPYAVRGKSVFIEMVHQAQGWSTPRRVIACIDWKPRETEESKIARKKNPKKKIRKQMNIFSFEGENPETNIGKQMNLFPVYSFVVTNNQSYTPEEVFSFYNGRATIENAIEEAKNEFDIDHLSNEKFKVNATNFQIHLLALQVFQLYRKFGLAQISKEETKQEERKCNEKYQESKNPLRKYKKTKVGRKIISLPSGNTVRKQFFSIPAKVVKSGRKIFYKCTSSWCFQGKFCQLLEKIQALPYFARL